MWIRTRSPLVFQGRKKKKEVDRRTRCKQLLRVVVYLDSLSSSVSTQRKSRFKETSARSFFFSLGSWGFPGVARRSSRHCVAAPSDSDDTSMNQRMFRGDSPLLHPEDWQEYPPITDGLKELSLSRKGHVRLIISLRTGGKTTYSLWDSP